MELHKTCPIQNRLRGCLHCSLSTFDNYIKLGLIPPGHKEYGFKELSWSEKDFDEATLYRINYYKDKHK